MTNRQTNTYYVLFLDYYLVHDITFICYVSKLTQYVYDGAAEKFAMVLREQQEVRRNREQQRIRLLTADPFDMEAQRLIANEIQQEVGVEWCFSSANSREVLVMYQVSDRLNVLLFNRQYFTPPKGSQKLL